MNYLWGGMILLGIVFGAFTGRLDLVTDAIISSSKEAITLCITMAGITSVWVGIMRIAEKAGLLASMQQKMKPLIHFLFPHIPHGHPAEKYISLNFIANFLGLGWAATPAGLKAMESLSALEKERNSIDYSCGIASKEMCDFLILNISSLQLIPLNIIAYRSQYGSANPSLIIAPAILATSISTITAILFCKLKK